MENIKVDFKNARLFEKNVMKYAKQVAEIHKKLHEKAKNEKEEYNKSNSLSCRKQ